MSARHSTSPRLVAISRSPTYSPLQHAANDGAILDAAIRELEVLGWQTRRLTERQVVTGRLPPADLYLNMCQGPSASEALLEHEALGHRFFNRPSSVLGCHRHRLIPALERTGIAMPATIFLSTDGPVTAEAHEALQRMSTDRVWLKRGGVHAERPEDVLPLPIGELAHGLADFAARGITLAAVQEHVPGPVIKFYGVAGHALFHAYESETKQPVTDAMADLEAVRSLAFRAAAAMRLDIFGGDLVMADPGHPVLIDLNDWPSFAPIRDQAGRAIAGHVHAARPRGVLV